MTGMRARSFTRMRCSASRRALAGFSLIEVMVAMVLGLLLSVGIVTLFGATSKTNKVQDSLARLQENGRYAMTRLGDDLRMVGAQYCDSVTGQGWTQGANGPLYPSMAIYANVNGVSNITSSKAFPDSGGTVGLPPTGWSAGSVYPLSPATFVRGYECAASGTCTPTVPSGGGVDGLPAAGTSAGDRVRMADVLTVRYQSGTGWPFSALGAGTTATVTLHPRLVGGNQVDDPVNFQNGDRALVTTCGGGQIFAANVSGMNLTPVGGSLLNPAALVPNGRQGAFDARVFNFDRDFLTVTYYLQYKADPSPDQPNRVIPVLMRRENGVASELVQGVERLDFVYGVQYKDSTFHYLTANQVNANSTQAFCPPPPPEWDTASLGAVEPGCLWRSVKSIEVHMLLDSVDNVYDLTLADTAYRYSVDSNAMTTPPDDPTAAMLYNGTANGSIAGRMMRREFVGMIASRNGNH